MPSSRTRTPFHPPNHTHTQRTTCLVAVAEEVWHALVAPLRVAGVRAVCGGGKDGRVEGIVTLSGSRFLRAGSVGGTDTQSIETHQ